MPYMSTTTNIYVVIIDSMTVLSTIFIIHFNIVTICTCTLHCEDVESASMNTYTYHSSCNLHSKSQQLAWF